MHYTTFASELNLPAHIAYGLEYGCQRIIADIPSHLAPDVPFKLFGWFTALNEKGQDTVLAGIGAPECEATIKMTPKGGGESCHVIPCWQIIHLAEGDEEVALLDNIKPTVDELANFFSEWHKMLDVADPKIAPIQHSGSIGLLAFLHGVSDRLHAFVHDDGDEVSGPDIQFRVVMEKGDDRTMLIIEPNPYTDRTAKRIGKHLN